MKRFDISGDGTIIDVSMREFYLLVAQFVANCFSFIENNIVNHVSGLADFEDEYFKSDNERIQRQFTFVNQGIEDEELNEQLIGLIELINFLSKSEDKIVAAYRETFAPTIKSKKPIQDLKKEVFDHLYEKHLPPPARVIKVAEETTAIIPLLEDIKTKLHLIIEHLMQSTNE